MPRPKKTKPVTNAKPVTAYAIVPKENTLNYVLQEYSVQDGQATPVSSMPADRFPAVLLNLQRAIKLKVRGR